jgi:protein-disulfide isomerase
MSQKKSRTAQERAAARARREARRTRTERAKAATQARRKAEQRRQRLLVGGVAVAVLALVAGTFFGIRSLDNSRATSAPPAGVTEESGLAVGSADAPRSVVVYEDFLCPACAALEASTTQQLTAAADQGDVRVEYRPVSILGHISDYSMRSANAFAVVLDTAGPEVAKEYHDILYANQPSESGPQPDDAWLVEKAVEAGAEESAVAAGIEDLAYEGWVKNATDEFSKAGHTGTPTVLVDGEVVEAQTIQEMAQAILGVAQR